MSHIFSCDFVSFSLFEFTLVIKLRNFDFESHWNALIIFRKKMYSVRFEYVPWKNVWFCFISIILVHFSHKTENSSFLKSLKWFKVFWKKKWRQNWICPFKQCLISFKLCCLSRILANSIQESVVRSKFVPFFFFFCLIWIFWYYYRYSFELKKFLMILRYIEIL